MARRKKKAEDPEADVVVLEAPAVEAPPVPVFDVSYRGGADVSRCVEGCRVQPTEKWLGLQLRMVWLDGPPMEAFCCKERTRAMSIANAERPQRSAAFGDFSRIPEDLRTSARRKWVLECLRGDGLGIYRWEGGELDLEGASTEAVREAVSLSLDSLDLEISTWLLGDLEEAAKGVGRFEDDVVVEAKKNNTGCGVPPPPESAGLGLRRPRRGEGAGKVDTVALLRGLDAMMKKAEATMSAATPKAPESPTG